MDWWPTLLFFNTLEPPYDNKDVRWAFAYAIDHQQVMMSAMVARVKTNLPFPGYPGLTKYRTMLSPSWKAMIESIYIQTFDKVAEHMAAAASRKNADGLSAGRWRSLQA